MGESLLSVTGYRLERDAKQVESTLLELGRECCSVECGCIVTSRLDAVFGDGGQIGEQALEVMNREVIFCAFGASLLLGGFGAVRTSDE